MSARNGVSSFTFNYISSIIFVLSFKKTSLEHHMVSCIAQTFLFLFLKTPLRISSHSLDSVTDIFNLRFNYIFGSQSLFYISKWSLSFMKWFILILLTFKVCVQRSLSLTIEWKKVMWKMETGSLEKVKRFI